MLVVQLSNISEIKESDFHDNDYKSKIYHLLSLFDQANQFRNNRHKLLLPKDAFPDFLQRIISRLQIAESNNPELENEMLVEDEYLQILLDKKNTIAFLKQQIDDHNKKAEQEKERAEQEKERADNQEKVIIELAKMLKENGAITASIIEKTKLSKEQIDNL